LRGLLRDRWRREVFLVRAQCRFLATFANNWTIAGLVITLAAVLAYAYYIKEQLTGLRKLQAKWSTGTGETRCSCCEFKTT